MPALPGDDPMPAARAADDSALSRIGGEFRTPALERRFAADQASENRRHARLLFIAAAILNTLFLASDWRFAGTAQFWIAVPARIAVVIVALGCLGALPRCRSASAFSALLIGWMAATALGVAALVSSHSDLALFVAVLLPAVYFLAVPLRFAALVAAGGATSVALLLGYWSEVAPTGDAFGLVLGMAVLNTALALATARANRLQRLGWLAIEREREVSRRLEQNRADIERMFMAGPVPLVLSARDDGRILSLNDGAATIFGHPATAMLGTKLHTLLRDPGDRAVPQALLDRDGVLRNHEVVLRRDDGTIRNLLLSGVAIDGERGPAVLSGLVDITQRKAMERRLEWLAATDALTGLPNRASFFTAARAALIEARHGGAAHALLMIDFDHFKQLNDSHGHRAGDQALRAFGSVCRAALAPGEIAGRLGGEEFAVLIVAPTQAIARDRADALRAAIAAIELPRPWHALRLSASIGLAPAHPGEIDLDGALARADAALYRAKHAGRNRVAMAPAPRPPDARRRA